jgi:hypothetical protein
VRAADALDAGISIDARLRKIRRENAVKPKLDPRADHDAVTTISWMGPHNDSERYVAP